MKTLKYTDKKDHILVHHKDGDYRANIQDEGWVLYTPDFKSIIGTYKTIKGAIAAVKKYAAQTNSN